MRNREIVLKRLTLAGFAGIGLGLAAMVVLHATSGLNPAHAVISAHLYTPHGWLLPVSLCLFAGGACAFAALARSVAAPRWMAPLLAAWAGLLLLVAAFPSDPPTAGPYSAVHFVHRYAAFAAFCVMAALAIAFGRWARGACRCARIVSACGWVALGSLAVTALPYALAWFDLASPWWAAAGGLNQRMTVGSELLALAVLGSWLRRGGDPVPEPPAVREPVPVPA
ncbi:DUF998 domain-containing protein [Glycomyces xiaoerkulensis]|uniref:DUF998 domain-containing protein n=1 Tax=Glycomyces xiaoerkulensis TaxID=2038139 RepID=UPI0012FFFAA5|nr:DUF998 domain-containing protein [Glycomyces xiaoerkulensis]